MTYLLIIFICSLIIYIPNAIINPANISLPWVYYLLAVIIFIAASVVVDGIVAFIGRKLPEKWMNPEKGMIKTTKFEEKLFKFLHVEKWKEHMPDLGRFTDFPKGNIMDPTNNEYLSRYILEASYGVVIHYLSVPFAPLILLLGLIEPTNVTLWTVGVPVLFVNMVLILLPAWTLKYNIPRLLRIKKINDRLAKRKSQQQA